MPKSYRKLPRPLRVALVIFPGCMPAGLFATADILRGANLRCDHTLFEIEWVSTTKAPVPVWSGQWLQPTALFRRSTHDVYLVPGIWATGERELLELLSHTALISALASVPARSALWSYCAGVALVAAAHRLDRKPATATWWMQPLLESKFSKVRWRFSENLTRTENTMTAAGPHGYLALLNEQLESTLSAAALRDVVELLMLPQPRNRHPLFRRLELLTVDPRLQRFLSYALGTDAARLDLRSAAAASSVSVRTLCRTIKAQSGLSAGEWFRHVKLKQAADQLIRTAKSVKQISLELGFSSEAGFHRTFRHVLEQTPLAFRRDYGDRL